MALPSGGSVDLQVLHPSTGQIYGAAEIPMALASPALFVCSVACKAARWRRKIRTFQSEQPVESGLRLGTVIQLYGTGEGFVTGAPPGGSGFDGSFAVRPAVSTRWFFWDQRGQKYQVPPANVQYSGDRAGRNRTMADQHSDNSPECTYGNTSPISLLMQDISSGNNATVPTEVVTTIAIK